MSHQITIDANVKQVTDKLAQIKKDIKSVGAEKVEFKVDDTKLISTMKFHKAMFSGITSEIKKLTLQLTEALDADQAKKFTDQINILKKELSSVSTIMKDLGGVKGGGGGGGGEAGIGGWGKFGLAAFGIQKAVGYASQIMQPSFALSGLRLGMAGLGAGPGEIASAQGSGRVFGFGPEASLQQAMMMRRMTGGTGALAGVQGFGRGIGIAPEEIIGAMGGMRQSGMSGTQSLRVLKDLFVTAVSKGFDESRAFDVLQAVSEHTAGMAQNSGVNVKGITDIVGNLMNNNFFAQNSGRAMAAMQGVEGAFTRGGPGMSLAIRALSRLPQYRGMSPINLLHQQGLGFTQSGGAGLEGYQSFLNQIGQGTTMKNLIPGGGTGQLNKDQTSAFAVGLKNLTGVNQSLADEIVDAFLKGDKQSLSTKMQEAEKTLEERTLDVMNTMSGDIETMKSDTHTILTNISDSIVPILTNTFKDLEPILNILGKVVGPVLKYGTWLGAPQAFQQGLDVITGKKTQSFGQQKLNSERKLAMAGDVYSYLKAKGVDDIHARGMMANIISESGFDPGIIGDGGTSGGLFQHHGDRFNKMANYVGSDWKTNWKKQIDFALGEKQTRDFLSIPFDKAENASKWFTKNWENPSNRDFKAEARAHNVNLFSDSDRQIWAHIVQHFKEFTKILDKQVKKAPAHHSKVTELSRHKKNQSE